MGVTLFLLSNGDLLYLETIGLAEEKKFFPNLFFIDSEKPHS